LFLRESCDTFLPNKCIGYVPSEVCDTLLPKVYHFLLTLFLARVVIRFSLRCIIFSSLIFISLFCFLRLSAFVSELVADRKPPLFPISGNVLILSFLLGHGYQRHFLIVLEFPGVPSKYFVQYN
jgi:hypothetical protein